MERQGLRSDGGDDSRDLRLHIFHLLPPSDEVPCW
jgi:hypothetical protein